MTHKCFYIHNTTRIFNFIMGNSTIQSKMITGIDINRLPLCRLNCIPYVCMQVKNVSKKRKKYAGRSTQGSQAGSITGASRVSSSPSGKPRKRHGSRAESVSSVAVSFLR